MSHFSPKYDPDLDCQADLLNEQIKKSDNNEFLEKFLIVVAPKYNQNKIYNIKKQQNHIEKLEKITGTRPKVILYDYSVDSVLMSKSRLFCIESHNNEISYKCFTDENVQHSIHLNESKNSYLSNYFYNNFKLFTVPAALLLVSLLNKK